MLNLSLKLSNLWVKEDGEHFDIIFIAEEKLTENKSYCFQISRDKSALFDFSLNTNWRGQDHAGPEFTLGLLTFTVSLHLSDNRHWNHEAGRWYTEEERIKAFEEYEQTIGTFK